MATGQAYVRKGIGGLTIGALLLCVFGAFTVDFFLRDQPDQGTRPLVIIATRGGEKKFDLHVRAHVAANGDFSFTYAVERPETTVQDDRAWVEYEISFIGERLDDAITCGDSDTPLASSPTEELSPGSMNAYAADRQVGRGSATNFGDPPETVAPVNAPASPTSTPTATPEADASVTMPAYRYSGRLATYADGEEQNRSLSPDESGYGDWVGECRIDASAVWGEFSGDTPTSNSQSTLLAPQFNLTSIDETTDYQSNLYASVRVDRTDGAVLTEGYPSPTAQDTSWFAWYTVNWSGEFNETSNFAYSDQPTYLFTNRDATRNDQLLQLICGLFLGVALALVVQSISELSGPRPHDH